MDALLGAAALGDIGKHFPDTDPAYKGISSIRLLEHVADLLEEHQFLIENIDATIIAQRPKMRPYIDTMRENIAKSIKKLSRIRLMSRQRQKRDLDLPEAGKGFLLRQSACSQRSRTDLVTK